MFVPLATDVVVAIGHRATALSPGYDLLTPLVPKSVLSPRAQALTIDLRVDRLYRVEFSRNLVTDVVDLSSIAPINAASGITRVSDGVALIVDWHDDRLYRLEHTNDAVTSVTPLGNVSTVAGRQIAPEAIAHVSAGVALISDNSSNRLYRVEYNDTSVTATTRLGIVSSQPFEMATIGSNAVLVADASYDGLYRLDFNQSGFSRTRLGKVPGLTLPLGLAHVSEGVALLVQDKNPDLLFRVEYGSTGVNSTYSLGRVNGLWGLNGLTSLPIDAPSTNRAPSAQNDNAGTIEGVPVAIDVLANDSDADGHVLTVASITQPSQGTTLTQSDGSVAYTPKAGFRGEDSFTYAATDGFAQATGTVTVTVSKRPLAVYDPDANRITVSEPGLVGDRFEVEETIDGVTTIHHVTSPEYTKAAPTSGSYIYRIRSCGKDSCEAWSSQSRLTVAVPDMFTDEPAVESVTVPGSLPYDVGVTKGGQAYVNIPVQPAPGVNGLQPQLSIDYSSGRERQRTSDQLPGDVLGYGWRVSGLSTIRRCTKNRSGSNAIVFGDTDGLCLDGEPLVRVVEDDDAEGEASDSSTDEPADNPFAAGTEYRTYRESYAKVIVRRDTPSGDPWFEVLYPDGRRAEYGRTDDSRLRISVGGVSRTAPFLRSVKVVRDAYGNAMTYHYHEDESSGVRHPLRIVYGTYGDAEVRFSTPRARTEGP